MTPLYTVSVCGGLETVAISEIETRLSGAGTLKIAQHRRGRASFNYTGDPRRLLSLRSAEHVFLVIRGLRNVTRSRHSLTALRTSLNRVDFRTHFDICRKMGLRLRRRVTFRVTSHMSGLRNYRRIDAQRVVEQTLQTYGWRLTDENPALDIWIEIHDDEAVVSIRLSPLEMAQRDYKRSHIPASLAPTVAYALVQLSDPQPDDLFLDPMCGAGTILIERAYSGRYRYLLGGDISADSVEATRINVGRKHRPRRLFHWDAGSLPLDRWSVNKIVCNPPFGGQIGERRNLEPLYRRFLQECHRVLKPTGRIVFITTQRSIFDNLSNQRRLFKIAQHHPVDLRGKDAHVYMCLPQ